MSNPRILASSKLKEWRDHPDQFVREVFGVEPDLWQIEILKAFPHNNRLAMKASKGVGKSTILSWCAWNFLLTRPHPKIAVTSISASNLSDGLWTEMAKWMGKSPLLTELFSWTKTRIMLKGSESTWWMSARTWAKGASTEQQANTLAGLHADYLLFILDEAGGIPDGVMAAAEAGLSTGGDTKIIMAGNPTHLEGPLYRACTSERTLWYLVEINSDPDSPLRSPRVSIEWAKEQIEKFGRDNPFVLVNVFGQFPPSSINALLGPNDIQTAQERVYKAGEFDSYQKRLGVDVARFGLDSTIIFPRQGFQSFNYVEMRNASSSEVSQRVISAKVKWDSDLEFIDETGGYGAGVVDQMRLHGFSPIGIHFSSKASDERFFNKRAEIWWLMAEWVKSGGALPKCSRLAKELTTAQYLYQNGKLRIEEKEQITKRLGFSTDISDALALTFSIPEISLKKQHNVREYYNPLGAQ